MCEVNHGAQAGTAGQEERGRREEGGERGGEEGVPAGSDGESDGSGGSSERGGWRRRKALQRSVTKRGAQNEEEPGGGGGAGGGASGGRGEEEGAGGAERGREGGWADGGGGSGTAEAPMEVDSGEGELSDCGSSEEEVLGMNRETGRAGSCQLVHEEREPGGESRGKKKRSREVGGLEGSSGFVTHAAAVDGGRRGSIRRRVPTAATPPTRKRSACARG